MASIKILPPETARLIAAGEVIERPASALRELLDNALDAEAQEIVVEIKSGGIELIRVSDNGIGMDAEDLRLSVLPHATSKIQSADDLLRARTLGFRGEALASIAAAATLEVSSRRASDREAHRLTAGPGREVSCEAAEGRAGTRVTISGLFSDFPARKQFLKRPQAEASLCKQVFIDKAIAHPGVSFKLQAEGRQSLFFPSVGSLKERLGSAYAEPMDTAGSSALHELVFHGEGFQGRIVISTPVFYKPDRRFMQVFVNRRRVQDYGLLSGLDDGFSGFLPGGAHPYAFLFLEMDPSLVDFNIHPAKREMRLKDPASPRRGAVKAIADFLRAWGNGAFRPAVQSESRSQPALGSFADYATFGVETLKAEPPSAQDGSAEEAFGSYREEGYRKPSGIEGSKPSWSDLAELRERLVPIPRPEGAETPYPSLQSMDSPASAHAKHPSGSALRREPRCLGQVFDLFLIVEWEDSLYLIDQHAAHERLLFDELSRSPPKIQELLIPYSFHPASEAEEKRLAEMLPALTEQGFRLEREADGSWLIMALPSLLRDDPESALRELVEGGEEDLGRSARALAACKAAIKDGELLGKTEAEELARRALSLPEPRCPHGRPVWHMITRESLFRKVRRIV